MNENDLAREIVDAAYKVHTSLGPGLLESVYEAAMAHELQRKIGTDTNFLGTHPIPSRTR